MEYLSKTNGYGFNEQNQPLFETDASSYIPHQRNVTGKKSFLVYRHNKYVTIPTENVAFFYVKYESSIMVCLDRKEYSVNYSLEHLQHLLSDLQFFRLNRQYLINFNAVKEVEHYFARKLLVRLIIPVEDQLLVSKEKA